MKAITAGKMVMAAPLGLSLPAGFPAKAAPITFSGYNGSGLNLGSNLGSGAVGGDWQHFNTSGRVGATTRLSTTNTGAFRPKENTGHISAAGVCPLARIHHLPLDPQSGRRQAGRPCNFIVTKK